MPELWQPVKKDGQTNSRLRRQSRPKSKVDLRYTAAICSSYENQEPGRNSSTLKSLNHLTHTRCIFNRSNTVALFPALRTWQIPKQRPRYRQQIQDLAQNLEKQIHQRQLSESVGGRSMIRSQKPRGCPPCDQKKLCSDNRPIIEVKSGGSKLPLHPNPLSVADWSCKRI